jgi:AsmA protein
MMDSNEQNQHSDAPEVETRTSPRLRTRLLWVGGIVTLVLLLLLTPPLLNVSRLRRRIATSMSASLGRPVHLDNVTLQMLPIPGFVLQNLVVSEDPAFGNEPIIRSNRVLVTLRPSSLWRRQIEVSSVRFQVDDFGTGPTLNLVRNARGEWNLQSLLMHAAQVDTAPTEQAKAGPAPRFPYVEATNGRINVKLGNEKQPFSLTEADFALWLPSTEQWRVRLVGKPTRTDTNVSDSGTMRLEGQLERAATMGEVPVDLHMSWHNAPLGEASTLMTGSDADWRGTLNADATLFGPLKAAKLAVGVHLNDLRRADFVPAKLLNVNLECSGSFDLLNAVMQSPSCVLPTPVPEGSKAAGQAVAVADTVELQEVQSAEHGVHGLRLGMTNVADSYVMDWARLFSQRVPAQLALHGTTAGSVVYVPASESAAGWQGEFHMELMEPATDGSTSARVKQSISLVANQMQVTLQPLTVSAPKAAPLVLAGEATMQGYSLRLAGTATAAQLQGLRGLLPPFGDGLETVIPELAEAKVSSEKPLKVNVACARAWGGKQTCSEVAAVASPKRRR